MKRAERNVHTQFHPKIQKIINANSHAFSINPGQDLLVDVPFVSSKFELEKKLVRVC